LTHKLELSSRENTLLQRKVHDLQTFTMATAFGSMGRGAGTDETACQLRRRNAIKKLADTDEKIRAAVQALDVEIRRDHAKKLAEANKKIDEKMHAALQVAFVLLVAGWSVQYMFMTRL
jgi:hypothetical protein